MKEQFVKSIIDAGIIAYASTKEKAADMITAGIGAVESGSLEVVESIKKAYPDICVGYVGAAEAADVAAAGADFYHGVVYCKKCAAQIKEADLCLVAVASTPVEAAKMQDIGADIIDFANADICGGIAMLGALSVAAPEAKFIVSGAEKPIDYTAIPACIGWTDKKIEDCDETATAAVEALYESLGLTLAHVGINAEDEKSAIEISTAYSRLLGLKQKTGNSSCFAGSWVEVMKSPYLGKNGHIAIGTRSLPRAIAFYQRRGVKFNMSTAKPVAIYFARDIGGFAVHLVEKK